MTAGRLHYSVILSSFQGGDPKFKLRSASHLQTSPVWPHTCEANLLVSLRYLWGINTAALLRSSSAPACSVFRLNGQVLPVTQERLAAILPALLHSADYGLPFSHSKFEPTLLAQELSLSDQNGGLSVNGN